MATRLYDRQIVRYDRVAIDILVEQGRAEYFPGLPGYVIDKKTPVRNHQIDEPAAPEDLAYLRSVINDQDSDVDYRQALQAEADAEDISVEELTDGEYTIENGIVVSVYDEDALFAKFGA